MFKKYDQAANQLFDMKTEFQKKFLSIYRKTERIGSFRYALWLLSWDQSTETPKTGLATSFQAYENIAKHIYEKATDKLHIKKILHTKELMDKILVLDSSYESLISDKKILINREYKKALEIVKIPKSLAVDLEIEVQKANVIWAKAKKENDFSIFAPTLKKVIDLTKKKLSYLDARGIDGFNYLLNQWEEGSSIEFYDNFFNKLKEELGDFVKTVQPIDPSIKSKFNKVFPVEKQIEFNKYLLKTLGFPEESARIKTSVHPFTSSFNSFDVRITTAYHEDNLMSFIFSTIHECGHAFYDLQNDPKLVEGQIDGQTNMALHESQSRFLENFIGRNPNFWVPHFPKLKEIFAEELSDVTFEDFTAYINNVERDLIRIEADELTYPFHIMLRYQIEKEIFINNLDVNELPKRWNELVKEYLGITVPSDSKGVLQDMHWSSALFGYFPTYALGSAYASQFYSKLNQDIDVAEKLKEGDFLIIKKWLKDNIHQYGLRKSSKQLLKDISGEEFNPNYYIEYLKGKFK